MSIEDSRTIELTSDMREIIDRMRGQLSPQAFLRLLLWVAASGAVSSPPRETEGSS